MIGSPIGPSLTAEQEVLLGAIRVDHARDERLRELLGRELDWAALRQMALDHGVLPLLYARLKAVGEDLLPSQEKALLRQLYLANAQRNLRLTQRLLKVLHLLASQGIEAIPLKGPALAVQAYGDPLPRQIIDLDILIHRRDIHAVCELLAGMGYHPNGLPAEKGIDKWLRGLTYEKQFTGPGGELLDVHWSLVETDLAFSLSTEQCWKRSRSCQLYGQDVRVLSLEDTLLFHCIHGAKSIWGQLKWVADVAHLVSNHPELDWKALWAEARKIGAVRVLSLGLHLAERFGGGSTSSEVRSMWLSDRVTQQLIDRFAGGFFTEREHTGWRADLILLLRSRERWRDRVKCVIATVFNQDLMTGIRTGVGFIERVLVPRPPDLEVVRLPRALFSLYYLIRPLRLLMKYTATSLRSLAGLCRRRSSDRQHAASNSP